MQKLRYFYFVLANELKFIIIMKMQSPKSISKPSPFLIRIEWRDGLVSTIKTEILRKECPCAGCKGESIAGKVVAFPKMQMFAPGQNDIKKMTSVGNYAITISWGDGHDTGIYNWDYLRDICDSLSLPQEQVEKILLNSDSTSKSNLN
jgi:DUF971 family protein